jgi:spore germination protein YaaH
MARTALLVVVAGLTGVPFLTFGAPAAGATTTPATVEAWIYPGSPGEATCDVSAELAALAAQPIAVLKPQYLTVAGTGKVKVDTAAALPCNGFSPAALATVRTAAHRVYVTVSAGTRAAKSLLASPAKQTAARVAIESFVATNGLDGVDLDFEPNVWSPSMWSGYQTFVSGLAADLAPADRSVEVDLGPFTTTPWDAERYAEVAAAGAHLVVMAYDDEYGVACGPIAPYAWLDQVVTYAQSQVSAADLTIGLPSYGYTTTSCSKVRHVTSNVPYVTMEGAPGLPTSPAAVAALRDPSSGEIRWQSGGTFYDYVDAVSLNAKLQRVEDLGVTDVSVWSLGGESWFTGNPG